MIAALYEDEDILVLDKPAGLASQPGAGVRVSVVEAVERDFGFRPFLVHRLDKETSGCLVVARSAAAAALWSRLLESRELCKTYRAIVAGSPLPDGAPFPDPGLRSGRQARSGRPAAGRFDDPIRGRDGDKAASTEWRLISSFGPYSYLELSSERDDAPTRIPILPEHGLPILGDDRHGDFALNRRLRAEAGLRRLLLVPWSLRLPGGSLVRASLPEHFVAFFPLFPRGGGPMMPGPRTAFSTGRAGSPRRHDRSRSRDSRRMASRARGSRRRGDQRLRADPAQAVDIGRALLRRLPRADGPGPQCGGCPAFPLQSAVAQPESLAPRP